jgi:thimet oligopeptidase
LSQLSAAEEAGLHPWNENGGLDAQGLEIWVQGRLERQRRRINALLAVQGQRTLENTLRPFDDAIATLSAAGSLASLLDSV